MEERVAAERSRCTRVEERRWSRATCEAPLMRLVLTLSCTVLVLSLSGCGGGSRGGAGSCADTVGLHGETLWGRSVDVRSGRLPSPAGTQRVDVPACDDSGNGERGVGTGTLTRLAGVAPEIALADDVQDDGRVSVVYLGAWYFDALPSHPLHRALWGSNRRPLFTRHRECVRARPRTGRVDSRGSGLGLFLNGHRRRSGWRVDVRTVVRAPHPAGMPRLRSGDRVRVTGVRCRGAGLVARRIVVTG